MEGRKRCRGILAGISKTENGDNVAIDLDKEDETALIPFAWISEAKLLITDAMIKQGQNKTSKKRNKKSPPKGDI